MMRYRPSPEDILEEDFFGHQLLRGLHSTFYGQIVDKSFLPHVIDMTPEDSTDRFSSVARVADWMREREAMYSLLDDEDLLGFAGFRHGDLYRDRSLNSFAPRMYEFSIRLYGEERNSNLAYDFMDVVHENITRGVIDKFPEQKIGFWLKFPTESRAVSLYKRFGYENPQLLEGGLKTYMILSELKTKELMGA